MHLTKLFEITVSHHFLWGFLLKLRPNSWRNWGEPGHVAWGGCCALVKWVLFSPVCSVTVWAVTDDAERVRNVLASHSFNPFHPFHQMTSRKRASFRCRLRQGWSMHSRCKHAARAPAATMKAIVVLSTQSDLHCKQLTINYTWFVLILEVYLYSLYRYPKHT